MTPRAGESRTVAIAGANGMVGHHLVEALQASGDRVIALVRQPSAHHFPSAVEIRKWQASDPVPKHLNPSGTQIRSVEHLSILRVVPLGFDSYDHAHEDIWIGLLGLRPNYH